MSDVESDESYFIIGSLLQNSWEVILLIFRYLSYKEILKVQTVCKTWQFAGKKVLEERKRIHYLTVDSPESIFSHDEIVNLSSKAVRMDIPFHIIYDFFTYVTSKPKWCLLFCNEDTWIKRQKSASVLRCMDYLNKIWSTTCQISIIIASGIIGTVENDFQGKRNGYSKKLSKEFFSEFIDSNNGEQMSKNGNKLDPSPQSSSKICLNNVGYSIEVEDNQNKKTLKLTHPISMLLIPEHTGVNMKYVAMNSIWITDESAERFETFNQYVVNEIGVGSGEKIKALLIFDVELEDDFIEHFLTWISEKQNSEIAIGGAMIESYHYTDHVRARSVGGGFALAFYGENVTAASVIIPQSAKSFSDVEKYILELKSCNLPEKKSIAFIFTCCGRGHLWYSHSENSINVESRAFRKHFLCTPLFGVFGYGEIGNVFLPKAKKKGFQQPLLKKKKQSFRYQYSSTIVLVSFL